MTLSDHIVKAIGGAAVSVASLIATGVEQVPDWLREFGLPTVMLAGAVVAIVFLYKELKASRLAHAADLKAEAMARLADRDIFIRTIREDAEKGEHSRMALLNATHEQTAEFKALRRELTRTGRARPEE